MSPKEYYLGEAEDMAEVVSLNEKVSIPYGSFTNCLKTKEWTPLEPSIIAYKYYAPNIGFVVESGSELVELIEIRTE
jgi:hypothetical protein